VKYHKHRPISVNVKYHYSFIISATLSVSVLVVTTVTEATGGPRGARAPPPPPATSNVFFGLLGQLVNIFGPNKLRERIISVVARHCLLNPRVVSYHPQPQSSLSPGLPQPRGPGSPSPRRPSLSSPVSRSQPGGGAVPNTVAP
jgi:hypothetical protein